MGLDMYLYEKEVNQVAYWRKANAIHGWIITNAQAEDNCTPIHMDMSDIVTLRDDCQKVVEEGTEEAAWEHVPPTGGFFFGNAEVDEWYWENIKDTLAFLNELIDNSDEHQEFEYQASW